MTLIKPKYTYEKLKRVEVNGKRRYAAPGGAPVASVTTILGDTKDKTHLIAWKKRVGEQKAQEIVTEASGVGTRMHKYLEDYIDYAEWPTAGSNPYAQQAHMMATTIKVNAMDDVDEIWGSEVPLYVPNIYAGTTDLVGLYKGQPCIMDFKQTNKPKKLEWVEDYFLQLTAYAIAHNEVHGTDIKEGHIFMCSRAGEYQQFDLWPDEFDEWEQEWWRRVYQYYEKIG
jgi:genome maintenance exonuclease 1|tara:strand:- start:1552 stop:2232 length:681 start_codon:yes stop_codon:yes gene_type:complete